MKVRTFHRQRPRRKADFETKGGKPIHLEVIVTVDEAVVCYSTEFFNKFKNIESSIPLGLQLLEEACTSLRERMERFASLHQNSD